MHTAQTLLTVLLIYGLVGSIIAVHLAQRGQPPATAATAVFAWPLLTGLLHTATPPREALSQTSPSSGPFQARIEEVTRALVLGLRNHPEGEVLASEIQPLRTALLGADARLGSADQLIASTDDVGVPTYRTLVEARARAAADIEEVIASIVELRLHIGLLALAGNSLGLREQLTALRQRADALAEVQHLVTP